MLFDSVTYAITAAATRALTTHAVTTVATRALAIPQYFSISIPMYVLILQYFPQYFSINTAVSQYLILQYFSINTAVFQYEGQFAQVGTDASI